MALSYFDLDTRLISTPVQRPQPTAAPRPAVTSPPVVVDLSLAEARPTQVDLDHAASYWVRRRRAEALLRGGQPT